MYAAEYRFADVTGDGYFDLVGGDANGIEILAQDVLAAGGCDSPRFGQSFLSMPNVVTSTRHVFWDVNADGLMDAVGLVPYLNELVVWSAQQAAPTPSPGQVIGPPPVTQPGTHSSVVVTLPTDRSLREREPDTLSIRRKPAGVDPVRDDWRRALSAAGVTLPANYLPLTGTFVVEGDVLLRRRTVANIPRMGIENRLGEVVTAGPLLERQGLDLTDGSSGVVIELPFLLERRMTAEELATIRVFVRRRPPLTAAEVAVDPLNLDDEANELVAVVQGIDGIWRETWRRNSSVEEIPTGSLANGAGPRFETDLARSVVRILVDGGGEFAAYFEP